MSDHDAGQEVLRLEGLKKSYNVGKPTEVEVLHGLDLRLQRSDFAALVGASGSGKSTLLHLLGGLDVPDTGELTVCGLDPRREDHRLELRRRHLGFVFQLHNLIGIHAHHVLDMRQGEGIGFAGDFHQPQGFDHRSPAPCPEFRFHGHDAGFYFGSELKES